MNYQRAFKFMDMTVTVGENGDCGLGLYSSNIEIVKVVPLTCMSVGLYLVNGEWGIHTTNVNSTFVIVITYYDVK